MVKKNHCTFSPDRLPGIGYIGDLCEEHDRDYKLGGGPVEKLAADLKLANAILLRAQSKILGRVFSTLYFRAVRIFGSRHFQYSKQQKGPEVLEANSETPTEN